MLTYHNHPKSIVYIMVQGWYCMLFVTVLVDQACLTLCSPMDCSLPGSSVHGILQARILEWVAISFSRGLSPLRDRIRVSWIAGRFFTIWATREALVCYLSLYKCMLTCSHHYDIMQITFIALKKSSVLQLFIPHPGSLGNHWSVYCLCSLAFSIQLELYSMSPIVFFHSVR